MKILYYGHSCISIQGGKKILIDPFLTGNPKAPISADAVEADYILVTHAHGDHLGDTVAIAKRTGAKVVAVNELANWLIGQGVDAHGMNIGGAYTFEDGFKVKLTQAWHSSDLDDGTPCGVACGFLFWLDGVCFYHAGDTGLFSDIGRIIGKHSINMAFLPIGGNYTMGPTDALIATGWLGCDFVVPIHFNTFPLLAQDGELFKQQVESKTHTQCVYMLPGDECDYAELVNNKPEDF